MPSPIRLLVVEDRGEDALLMIREVRAAGFEPGWVRVESRESFLAELVPEVDVILADYELPQFGAPDALELIRAAGLDIPVVIVTGALGDEAAVECLKRGAADFVLKDRLRRLGPAVEGALQQRLTRQLARRTADALRESEARFRLLMDGVRDYALVMLDPEGRVASWNAGAQRIYGLEPAQALAAHLSEIHPDLPGDEALRVARGEGRFEREGTGLRADGSRFRANVILTALADEAGTPLGFALVARDVTERHQTRAMLEQYAGRLEDLTRRLFEVQEAERRHLALELHDQIGQSLAALKIQLIRASSATDAGRREEILREGSAMVDEAIEMIRSTALELRPAILDQVGLLAAVEWLLRSLAARAGLATELTVRGSPERMSTEVETACFRAAQESLTNVVRHARARRVRIEVAWEPDEFRLEVVDDGRGFDLASALDRAGRGRALGLFGMQERIRVVGGRLEIHSRPGAGTRVALALDRPAAARADGGSLGGVQGTWLTSSQ